jgi:hypothetical protein
VAGLFWIIRRSRWKWTVHIGKSFFPVRQKKSWVDSGSGNLPSE